MSCVQFTGVVNITIVFLLSNRFLFNADKAPALNIVNRTKEKLSVIPVRPHACGHVCLLYPKFINFVYFLLYCLYYVTRSTFCILLCMHEDAVCLMIFDKRGIDKPRNLLISWSQVIYIHVGQYFIRNTIVIFFNMEHMKINIR